MNTSFCRSLAALAFSTALISVVSPSVACTGIRLKAADGTVVYARTLEFAFDLQSKVIVVPRNKEYTGTAPDNKPGMVWKTKYAVAGANGLDLPVIVDGVNEKGLAAGIFFFPSYAEYQKVDEADFGRALAAWELPLYLLTTCQNLDEALAAVQKIRVSDVRLPKVDLAPTFHYALHDASGRSAVLEYVGGELKIHDNPLGVITNAPTFDWHITNLANYVNLSVTNVPALDLSGMKIPGFGQGTGTLGLPGDFTPPSRFVRAVAFSQSALPVETAGQAVLQAFHLLNQFDIPKGVARGNDDGKTTADFTMWTAASDLKNRRYYFHTYANRRIRMIDLSEVDLDVKDVKSVSMDQPEVIEDLSGSLK